MIRKLLTLVLAVVVIVSLVIGGCAKPAPPAPAPAPEKLVLRLGHCAPPGQIMDRANNFFKNYVEEHTGGAIEIEIYPQSQLGGERAMFDQVLAGTLDMASIGAPIQSTAVKEYSAFCLPFVIPDEDVFWDMTVVPSLRNKLFDIVRERIGVETLGFDDGCARGLLNKKRTVRSPDDVKGLKIRVMEGAIYADMFTALGAITAPIPFPEVYTALQQGVIDGEDNSCDMAIYMKFVEQEKFFTDTNQTIQTNPLIVSKSAWAKLTEEQKQIFREAGLAMDIFSEEDYLKERDESYDIARDKYGVEVTLLTPQEREAFVEKMSSVHDKYKPIIGEEFYDLFMSVAKECRQKLGK